MRNLIWIAILCLTLLVGCQKAPEEPTLPEAQAMPMIDVVKNFKLANEATVSQTLNRAIQSLKGRGVRIEEKGWRAYPGPEGCQNCAIVRYVVIISGDGEKYEFLVKDGGKTVEGMNPGTARVLSVQPAPEPATEAEKSAETEGNPTKIEENPPEKQPEESPK